MTTVIKSCIGLMLIGALASGAVTWLNLRDLSHTYAAADPGLRRFMLYGPYLPLIDKVERHVPQSDGFLLDADPAIDPALVGYGISPRRVWQPDVDPEMRILFKDAPESPYPRRDPASFPVKWLLRVTPENLPQGGTLMPIGKGGGQR